MKRFMGLVVAVALLASSSVVNAADEAWFTMESTTCVGAIATSGQNQALSITKPNTATCNITIGYNLTSSNNQTGLQQLLRSYAFQLDTTPDITLVNIDQTQGDALGFTVHQNFNTAGSFIDIAGSNTGNGVALAPGGTQVARFTIQISKPNGGSHNIFGDYGTFTQVYAAGPRWFGGVGPNGNTYGQPSYPGAVGAPAQPNGFGDLAVIKITNVPEPATLALLGMGALALIRRRR